MRKIDINTRLAGQLWMLLILQSSTKMPRETRKSYPVSLKLDAIDYAKTTSNHVAARMFGVDHTQISRWRMKEEDLRKARLTNRRVGSSAFSNI